MSDLRKGLLKRKRIIGITVKMVLETKLEMEVVGKHEIVTEISLDFEESSVACAAETPY